MAQLKKYTELTDDDINRLSEEYAKKITVPQRQSNPLADRVNAIAFGNNQEAMDRMRRGQMGPLDMVNMGGRIYDSAIGAPTRAALNAAYEKKNPFSAAYGQFLENPDMAPDFGMIGNALADPFVLAGGVTKAAKYATQLPELGGVIGRVSSHSPSSGAEFKAAIDSAIKSRPDVDVGKFVSEYAPEELDRFRTFLSPGGKSGFAIKPDGDLINVFSSEKGQGANLMRDAIDAGPKKLDAFDGYLPKLYKKYGFNELKREANWTPGGPDVVYMKRGIVDRPQDLDNQLIGAGSISELVRQALAQGTSTDKARK